MRILLLSAEYPPLPGGVGDYTRQLAAALRSHGHMVYVLTIQHGRYIVYGVAQDGSTDEQIFILDDKLHISTASWGWTSWNRVNTILERFHPDLLHIQYQTGAYAMHPAINLLPWRLRRRPGRPLVAVTFHDLLEPYLFPKAGPLRRWVNRRLACDADLVVATNAVDQEGLRRYGVAEPFLIPIGSNIAVDPPGDYDREEWRTRLGLRPDDLLITYFGLLSPNKGADQLVEALPYLAGYLCLLGGTATAPQDREFARRLTARIAALNLGSRVLTTGYLNAGAISAYLLASDVVALPFRDGASFRRGSLLAALAHGCAVLTTCPTDEATAGRLRDGQEALLVPPGDQAALIQALERLMTDQPLRKQLGATGRRLATRFSWSTIAHQHEELYRTYRP